MVLNNSLVLNTAGAVFQKYGGQQYFDDIGTVQWAEYCEDINVLICATSTTQIEWYDLSDVGFSRIGVVTGVTYANYRRNFDINKSNGNLYYAYKNDINVYIRGWDKTGTTLFAQYSYNYNALGTPAFTFLNQATSVMFDKTNNKLIIEFRYNVNNNLSIVNTSYTTSDYVANGSNYGTLYGLNYINTNRFFDVFDLTTKTLTIGTNFLNYFNKSDMYYSYLDKSNTYLSSSKLAQFSPFIGKVISVVDGTYSLKYYNTAVANDTGSELFDSYCTPKIFIYDPYDKNKFKEIKFSNIDGVEYLRSDYWATLNAYNTDKDYNKAKMPHYRDLKIMPKSGNVLLLSNNYVYKLTPDCETVLASYRITSLGETVVQSTYMIVNPVTEEVTVGYNTNEFMLDNNLLLIKQNPTNVDYITAYLPGLLEVSSNENVPAEIIFPGDDQLLSDTTPTVTFKVNRNPVGWTQQFRVVADTDLTKLRSGSAVTVYQRILDSWTLGDYYVDATWEYSTDFNPTDKLNPLNGTWVALGSGPGLQKNGTHIINGIDSNQGQYYVRLTLPDSYELTGADTGTIWEFKVYSYSKKV